MPPYPPFAPPDAFHKAKDYADAHILPWLLRNRMKIIFFLLIFCCCSCCYSSRAKRLKAEAEILQRKQQTQFKMAKLVKEKSEGGSSEPKKKPKKGQNSGKRRSVSNASATDSTKESTEQEEEERAMLITDMQEGVGLQSKALTSSMFRSSTGLTTVRIQCDVPFKQKDVFRELINKKCPIDIDEEKMASIESIRPGSDRTKPTTSPGYVRKTVYKNKMTTLHELVDIKEPRLLKWRILDAKRTPFKLKGFRRAPECTIELRQNGVGTQCEISYVFEHSEVMIPCCCLAPLTPLAIRFLLVRSLQRIWTDLMLDRGYDVRCRPTNWLPSLLPCPWQPRSISLKSASPPSPFPGRRRRYAPLAPPRS